MILVVVIVVGLVRMKHKVWLFGGGCYLFTSEAKVCL